MDLLSQLIIQVWYTVDSKKLEYGPGTIYAGFPFFQAFGVEGQSYSNFLASTVGLFWGCLGEAIKRVGVPLV